MPATATQKRLSALFDTLIDFRASSPTAEAWGQLEVYLIIDDYLSDRFRVDEYIFSSGTMLDAKTEHREPRISDARSVTSYIIQRQDKRISAYVGEEGETRPM